MKVYKTCGFHLKLPSQNIAYLTPTVIHGNKEHPILLINANLIDYF